MEVSHATTAKLPGIKKKYFSPLNIEPFPTIPFHCFIHSYFHFLRLVYTRLSHFLELSDTFLLVGNKDTISKPTNFFNFKSHFYTCLRTQKFQNFASLSQNDFLVFLKKKKKKNYYTLLVRCLKIYICYKIYI